MSIQIVTRVAGGVVHGHLRGPGGPLTFAQAMRAFGEPAVRQRWAAALAAVPFPAFFWECAPVEPARERPFAFVSTPSPALARITADARPFSAHVRGLGTDEVACFPNLSRRSLLLAPPDVGPAGAHLARFLREGPDETIDALWAALPAAVERWFARGAPRLWLSTSGLGVHWLHLRLDPTPKYYTWQPFRPAPGSIDP